MPRQVLGVRLPRGTSRGYEDHYTLLFFSLIKPFYFASNYSVLTFNGSDGILDSRD